MNKICRSSYAVVTALALSSLTGLAVAKEYNKPRRLPAEASASVSKVIAEGYRRNDDSVRPGNVTNTGCGNLSVGNVNVEPGQRAPQRVITVVRGSVINVNRGCR